MQGNNVASEVRAVIARDQLSQVELAAELDLTPTQLSRRVQGKVPFLAEEIGKLARVLDIPVGVFYGEQHPAAAPALRAVSSASA